jgi:hypothetical protein
MKTAALLLASLITTLPAVSFAQGMDMPGTESAPAAGGAPVAGPDGAPAAKPQKSGPYFGFSLGTGKVTMSAGGESLDTDDRLGAVDEMPLTLQMQLRSGWGTGPFLFGMQLNWTMTETSEGGITRGEDMKAWDLVATWWDQEMGLYARAGLGPCFYQATSDLGDSDVFQGMELMLGFGATMGGLGVGIDMMHQTYDEAEAGFDSMTQLLATLSLDFY